MKKYTMSRKRKEVDLRKSNWEMRLDILILRNQGGTYKKIAEKYDVSRQAVTEIYKKIAHMTVRQAEKIAQSLE